MLSTTSFPVLLALYLLCLPALITPALLAASSTNLTSPSLSEIEHWQYSIPKTTLLLRMAAYPPQKIDRRALGQTLLRAQTRVREHISRYGDGELWDEDDRMCFFTSSFSTPPYLLLCPTQPSLTTHPFYLGYIMTCAQPSKPTTHTRANAGSASRPRPLCPAPAT